MKARVWFGKRTSLAPDDAEMIVPIGIFAADDGKHFTIDRRGTIWSTNSIACTAAGSIPCLPGAGGSVFSINSTTR